MPTRYDPPDGPADRVAIIGPGRAYSPANPLLEFARLALLQHGWTVQQLWWDEPEDIAPDWPAEQVRAAVEAESCEQVLVVGKSLGTRASPYAARRGLPAIWLTPLLVDAECVAGIRDNPAPQLLVGGLDDQFWDTDVAAGLAGPDREVVEIPGADHAMCVPGDAIRSAEIHVEVSRAIDTFLSRW
ncbi:MAG: hypothetical protein ACRDOM_11145 [Nocardioides sp.]